MSTPEERNGSEQVDLFGICLTGSDEPEVETEQPTRREDARPQPRTRPTR